MIKLIDTHAHLDHVENVEQVLKEAYEGGVAAVVAVGIGHSSNVKNLEIKKRTKSPEIFVALGIHPESLVDISQNEIDRSITFIKENLKDAVAVGEIGLDFWYPWAKGSEEKKKLQKQIFETQLGLAKEFDKPVVIHSRGAWRECLDATKNEGIKKAVFHWYSGPLDVLGEILKCGYFISATPALSYSPYHRDAVLEAPIENLLIETDSPVFYKDKEKESGFRANPKDVFKTLAFYAQFKKISEAQAAEVFCRNAREFFGIL